MSGASELLDKEREYLLDELEAAAAEEERSNRAMEYIEELLHVAIAAGKHDHNRRTKAGRSEVKRVEEDYKRLSSRKKNHEWKLSQARDRHAHDLSDYNSFIHETNKNKEEEK